MNANDIAIQGIVEDLIDSCVVDDILCIHRSMKLDYSHLLLADPKDALNGENESANHNSFTKSDSGTRSSTVFVHCARCNSKVAATRYASHLSNCMGLGRNSSRRANRLIAEQRRFEDTDDVEDAYYYESSPMSFSGHKSESSLNNFSKTSSYPSRSSKSNLRLAGISSKASNGRNCNTIPGDSMFEKADSFESVAFSCGDDDGSNSSEAPRRSGSSRNRRHQKVKPNSIAASLPHFLLKSSCESEEDADEFTCDFAEMPITDTDIPLELDESFASPPPTKRRHWFKGLQTRLHRLFMCCMATKEK